MANLKTVFKNSLLYSSSSLLLRASSIIFFPIFSYYLTKSDYGIISIAQGIVGIMATFTSVQMEQAITRFTFIGEQNKRSEDEINQILGSAFTLVFLVNSLVFGIMSFIGPTVLSSILNEIPYYPFIFYAIMAMPFSALVNLYRLKLKARHEGKKVFVLDMLYFGGNIGFGLLLVIVFKLGALGILLSILICGVLFSVFFLFDTAKELRFGINFKVLKPMLAYALPFIPFIALGFLLEHTDRLFLNSKTDSDTSGIYYIAITFASIFSAIKESVVSAIAPWFYNNFTEKNYAMITKVFYLILWSMGLIAVGLSLFGYEVLSILSSNPDFILAWRYIPVFVVGLFIVFIGQLTILPTYHAINKVKYLSLANLAGFLINLIGCYFLIESFGIPGAAISKISGYTAMTLVMILINNATTKFRWNMLYIMLPLLLVSVASFGHYIEASYLVKLLFKILFCLAYLGVLSMFFIRSFGGLKAVLSLLPWK